MKPSFHQMFRATCLLREPFLIDRKVWSGLRVAIRPMGTLRAMVRPQSLMQLCSHELEVASSPSPGQVYGITLSTFELEGRVIQSFLLGVFGPSLCTFSKVLRNHPPGHYIGLSISS